MWRHKWSLGVYRSQYMEITVPWTAVEWCLIYLQEDCQCLSLAKWKRPLQSSGGMFQLPLVELIKLDSLCQRQQLRTRWCLQNLCGNTDRVTMVQQLPCQS